jgi:Fic family protein
MKLYHTKPAYLSSDLINRIDEKWHRLKTHRPLSPTIVNKLRERFMLEMTYNSNAIEGNNLTYKETYLVINEGITIKGKSLKNHLEVKSHQEALEFIYDLVDFNSHFTLSQNLIRQIQSLVISPIEKNIAGKYRTGTVAIAGSNIKPPLATEIPYLMSKIISWFGKNQKKLHPIELASILHHKLVAIHPFDDGNGRTARLTMNIMLLQAGYPLVVILKNDRKKYYDTLSKADKGNILPFIQFITQSVERSLSIYIETIIGSKSKSEKYLTLSELSKNTKFSAKYLNLLARKGRLEAHKEGRNWLSTKMAIEEYLKK